MIFGTNEIYTEGLWDAVHFRYDVIFETNEINTEELWDAVHRKLYPTRNSITQKRIKRKRFTITNNKSASDRKSFSSLKHNVTCVVITVLLLQLNFQL
mgnify:CR=1 FL=1